MNGVYAVGGFALFAFGVYLTKTQIEIFRQKKQDESGWDIKGLGVGIMAIMIGLYLILNICKRHSLPLPYPG